MIRTISIKDFKSLRDVTVELSPVTVLVGKSGTGKSNFVHAVRFLRDYLFFGEADEAARGPFNKLGPLGREKFCVSFDLSFDIAGVDGLFRYSLSIPCGQGEFGESLQLNDHVFFSHVKGEWKNEPNVVNPPRPNGSMLGKLPSVSEAVIAFSALTSGIGCYEFPFGVLSQPIQSSKTIAGLADNAGNYLTIMKEISGNLRDLNLRKNIVSALKTLNGTVAAVELNSIQNPSNILVTHQFNGSRIPFSLSQESEGFRRFLAHLLAIYQESPKQILIFEEPENGIYPGALELMACELKSAPESGRGQVILTTHSPGLLDHFDPAMLRVVELAGSETRIGPVADYQLQSVREHLLRTGELLTVDEARSQEAEAAQP